MGAALPLLRRELFDTLQDPLRFSVVPVTLVPIFCYRATGEVIGPGIIEETSTKAIGGQIAKENPRSRLTDQNDTE